MRPSFRAHLLALCCLLTLTGCVSGSRTIARVGNHAITEDDYLALAQGAQLPGPPEQARQQIVDELVRRELVRQAAVAHGSDTTIVAREAQRVARQQVLAAALYADMAPVDVVASEAEARRLWEWRATQSEVEVVLAPDAGTMSVAQNLLASGAPFEQVADRINEPGQVGAGGRVGMILPATLPPPIDDAVRTLPIGKVGGPYVLPMGQFLVKVTARKSIAQPPFETQRTALLETLRRRKVNAARTAALLRLEAEYGVKVLPHAGATLFRMLSPGRDALAAPWHPSEAERKQALATWSGGAYTLGDAVDDLLRQDTEKPNSSMTPALSAWVEQQVMLRVLVTEAQRRHLDDEPRTARMLDAARNEMLEQGELQRALVEVGAMGAEQARATWEQVKNDYPQIRSANVLWVMTQDSTRALAVAAAARAGVPLPDAVRAVDPSLTVVPAVIRYPNMDPMWAATQAEMSETSPGESVGPEYTGRGWRVVQLLAKEQRPIEWEELSPAQQQSVEARAVSMARQSRWKAYTDSLRHAIQPVEYVTENIRRLPWPVDGTGEVR